MKSIGADWISKTRAFWRCYSKRLDMAFEDVVDDREQRRIGGQVSFFGSRQSGGDGGIGPATQLLLPKLARGAVIGDDFGLSGQGDQIQVRAIGQNPDTYRVALLFNERLDYPLWTGGAALSIPDQLGLEETGVLQRSGWGAGGTITYENVHALPYAVYHQLETREPGRWSIWHEPYYDPMPPALIDERLSARVALQNCLIVPSREVPLEDVIEFRERYLNEMRNLRDALERVVIKIAEAGPDKATAFLEQEGFERAMLEYLEVARKPNWRKALATIAPAIDWGAGFRASMASMASTGVSAAVGLPLLTAALNSLPVGAAAAIEIKSQRGSKEPLSNRPFEYLVSIDRELG